MGSPARGARPPAAPNAKALTYCARPGLADCYMRLDLDGAPCDDGNPQTQGDQCYQGACGSWMEVDTTVASEQERLQWVESDPFVNTQTCTECEQQFPMYLALDISQQQESELTGHLGHGPVRPRVPFGPPFARLLGRLLGRQCAPCHFSHGRHFVSQLSVTNVVYSYMRWKHPDIHFSAWRVDPSGLAGDMRGRALFMSKSGGCAAYGQWGGAGSCSGDDANVAIRSESQYQVDGYSKMQVFVASPSVTVSNVQTHSTRSYVAEPINEFQPYCAPKPPACARLPKASPAGV